jgi:hypothetical protein
MKIFIYQIFYDLQTKNIIEDGYIPLDNFENKRPDWREYFPISNFLKESELDENAYYGFFSPKFKQKTGLNSQQIKEFINLNHHKYDVFLYSPYFDQVAFFKNVFEQMFAVHPPSNDLKMHEIVSALGYEANINELIMDSRNSVFSNYIVAKPKFWRRWIEQCEKIFSYAEDESSSFHQFLNQDIDYHTNVQLKVFVMERIASLILTLESQFSTKAYEFKNIILANPILKGLDTDLILLDALKIAYSVSSNKEFFNLYIASREFLIKSIELRVNHGKSL